MDSLTAFSSSAAIGKKNQNVEKVVTDYRELFNENKGGNVEKRQENYMTMVNSFYNMVTDLYEFGWGQSFHFAPRHKSETFETSIAKHEHYLAHKLQLKEGQKCVDLGCGVGGPGRCIARFSGASVVGVNNNEYQLERCRKLTYQQGPRELCSYIKADFMHVPVEDQTFDAAFHIEAIVHSPDRVASFKEVLRTLKPGGLFGGYDWVITDKHDPNNREHVRIKKDIELGNSLPDLLRPEEILEALKQAGFEIVEAKDLALFNPEFDIPWYDSLEGKYWSISSFKHTPLGIWLTNKLVWTLETIKIAPKGTLDIHNLLHKTAIDLVDGGRTGTFSPMYFFLARKPLKK